MIGSDQTTAHDMESDKQVIYMQSPLSPRAFHVVPETLNVAGWMCTKLRFWDRKALGLWVSSA